MKELISLYVNWKVKLGILILVITGVFFWHKSELSSAVKVVENKTKAEIVAQYEQEILNLRNEALTESIKLQSDIDQQRKNKDAQIASANARYTTLANSLRDRPSRPTSNSGVSESAGNATCSQGTTGEGLYRDDAEFLSGYARDSEELKLNLLACYEQYDTVKKTLEDFKAVNTRNNKGSTSR